MKRNETESIIDPISVQYTITYKHLCLYDPDYEKPATACMMILLMNVQLKPITSSDLSQIPEYCYPKLLPELHLFEA